MPGVQAGEEAHTACHTWFYGRGRNAVRVRTAYRCRAYPGDAQQQMLARTFGCVRVVWNRTLAGRHAPYAAEGTSTSYAQTDAALTAMKKDPDLAYLSEVSSVPLQQALRHQHAAFQAFFAKRARYPRFKSRYARQSATYTRSAFRMKDGVLWLAKSSEPLAVVWTWPDADLAALDPASVTVTRDPAGRWFVTFHADVPGPAPLPRALAWTWASRTSPPCPRVSTSRTRATGNGTRSGSSGTSAGLPAAGAAPRTARRRPGRSPVRTPA